MNNPLYAIVDIETTGGNASGSRITEIAILIHDGTDVVEQFETLVNPEREIPLPIFALTGISNEMVRKAPLFRDIAETVFSLLSGKVFVAHSVNFDYSFVRHELQEAGFKWTAQKLCTVRAARKIRPGLASYGLGNLCRALEIPIENRHRAGGDAHATAILFTKLLAWDIDGVIGKMVKKTAHDQRLPPNLPPEDFENLPHKPGVYYFYNQYRKVIYVGKAVNLKKRVASHFTGHNVKPQRQLFLRDIHGISFEVCATELMALLLECAEIKKLWPAYNTALKRFEPKFGLFEYEARNGYRYLAIGKRAKHQGCVREFGSLYDGIETLRNLADQFSIDQRFCKYGVVNDGDFYPRQNASDLPDARKHNRKVQKALDSLTSQTPSFAVIDKGRSAEERSCVWVEAGRFYGMGYLPIEASITDAAQIKAHVTPSGGNQYMMQLIASFAKKYPDKVLLFEKS